MTFLISKMSNHKYISSFPMPSLLPLKFHFLLFLLRTYASYKAQNKEAQQKISSFVILLGAFLDPHIHKRTKECKKKFRVNGENKGNCFLLYKTMDV